MIKTLTYNVTTFISAFRHKQITKDAAAVFGVQFFSIFTKMLLSVIIVRSLTVESMGIYKLIMAYVGLSTAFNLPGFNIIINKGALKGHDQIFYIALKRSFIISIAFSVVFLGAGAIAHNLDINEIIVLALLLIGIFLPVDVLGKYDNFLQGKKEFLLSRKIRFFTDIASLITVGCVVYFTRSISYIILSGYLIKIPSSLVGLYFVNKRINKENINKNTISTYLKQGYQQTWLAIGNIFANRIDSILIGTIDPSLLAIYHIGTIIPKHIKKNIKGLLSVPSNYWGALSEKQNLVKLKKHGLKIFGVGATITICIWIFSPWVIPALYGSAYRDSVTVIRWFSLLLGFSFFTTLIGAYDQFQLKGHWTLKIRPIRQGLYLLLLFLLVPRFHIWGLLISILVVDSTFNAMFILAFWKRIRLID